MEFLPNRFSSEEPIFHLFRESIYKEKNKIVVFDRDNTIIHDLGKKSTFDGITWMPGALRSLNLIIKNGFHVSIVSNQAAIEDGKVPLETALRVNHQINDEMIETIGRGLHSFIFCPHSKSRNCLCRKPKSSMLTKILEIDPNSELFVMFGDKSTDISAANAFGIKGYLTHPGEIEKNVLSWLKSTGDNL